MNKPTAHDQSAATTGGRRVLCFVVDTDFVYGRELAKSLRLLGFDTVEFVNSGRLGETVENLNPDIVFINLSATEPVSSWAAVSLRSWKVFARWAARLRSKCCRRC
jgi:hypothetical protein